VFVDTENFHPCLTFAAKAGDCALKYSTFTVRTSLVCCKFVILAKVYVFCKHSSLLRNLTKVLFNWLRGKDFSFIHHQHRARKSEGTYQTIPKTEDLKHIYFSPFYVSIGSICLSINYSVLNETK
jgi:hypothetical protein